MATKKSAKALGPQKFEVRWSSDHDVGQVYVDEMLVQVVNERAYITFGQIRMPLAITPSDAAQVEIRPMARLIVSVDTLKRMLAVLNPVVEKHTKDEGK